MPGLLSMMRAGQPQTPTWGKIVVCSWGSEDRVCCGVQTCVRVTFNDHAFEKRIVFIPGIKAALTLTKHHYSPCLQTQLGLSADQWANLRLIGEGMRVKLRAIVEEQRRLQACLTEKLACQPDAVASLCGSTQHALEVGVG